MTAEEMWERCFGSGNDRCGSEHSVEPYEAWAFGSDPDKLAELVVRGVKTATSSAYALYEIDNEALPEAGEYSVILDSHDNAVCIIKTAKVYVTSFDRVSEAHAYKEGEGDRSLEYWREVHEKFFTDCLREAGLSFSPTMEVVCEEFEVIYKHG